MLNLIGGILLILTSFVWISCSMTFLLSRLSMHPIEWMIGYPVVIVICALLLGSGVIIANKGAKRSPTSETPVFEKFVTIPKRSLVGYRYLTNRILLFCCILLLSRPQGPSYTAYWVHVFCLLVYTLLLPRCVRPRLGQLQTLRSREVQK